MRRQPFIAMLFFGASLSLFAQATGRLTGTVADQSGAKIPGAAVSVYLAGGKTAILSATTSSEGVFDFTALRADYYDLSVEAAGFTKSTQARVKVDPARDTALPVITLQVASSSQAVEVTAAAETIQSTSFEVATTVTQRQVDSLPILDRQIVNLFSTQAGVGSNGITATVINGLRPSYSGVTIDGINVQDNWVRTNTLDYMPNRLTMGQVAEMTVSSSNSNVSIGGGANQITMVTPSGSNQFHGSAYWFNRNSHFAANDWFNNQNGVVRPFLNLNQVGTTIGGPIIKDKLLFYGNYEAYRRRSQTPILNTVLTPAARQGILTYRDSSGATRQFNVLQAFNLSIDPTMQQLLRGIPENGNSNQAGDGLNTMGYSFNAGSNVTRDIATGKIDYYLTPHHSFSGSFIWNRDRVQRPDLGSFYTTAPPTSNDNRGEIFTVSWRWNVRPTLTNEVRGGFNRTKGPFKVANTTPGILLAGLLFTSPVNSKLPEGRDTSTYSVQDNANWLRGKHSLSFGYQAQLIRVPVFDYASTVATYTLGLSATGQIGFSTGDIPGLRANDLGTANNLLSNLAGLVNSGTRNFNVTSPTSGFVPGAPLTNNWNQDNHAFYVSDNWRVRRRLSMVLGVRWDYYTVANERNSLQLQPLITNHDPFGTLLSNATLDLYGNSVGRPLYKRDLNNFAPNIGFAWDVFGDGKTAVRGGYSIAYANDNTGNSIFNTTNANAGLLGTTSFQNANDTLRNLRPLNAPVFKLPITARDNWIATGSNSTLGLVDPNLATPYVQQWSLGVQREVKGTIIEARYVGNHSVKSLRQIDANQVNPFQGGFLDDFKRARSNGFLALNAGLGFNPAFNANLPGSRQLTVFPTMPQGGLLTNATIRGAIQRGEIGTLAQTYATNALAGDFQFFPNPQSLFAGLLTNTSNSSFDAFQVEARRSFRSNIQFQANYVFSKALTDATALRGLDPALDNRNPRLERSRAAFDATHVIKLNHTIALPFGKGHRYSHHTLNPVIGGWQLAGTLGIQTGAPISIFSARGTYNRGSRSGNNTVDTLLNRGQLDDVVGFYMTGNGPYFINPKAIGPDGRGVAGDGSAPFQGQAFFNPDSGTIGSLNRRTFDGPLYRGYDCALLKSIPIKERHSVQFRAEFFNLTNTTSFLHGSVTSAVQNVNSATFGKITATASLPRQVQFSLYYKF